MRRGLWHGVFRAAWVVGTAVGAGSVVRPSGIIDLLLTWLLLGSWFAIGVILLASWDDDE